MSTQTTESAVSQATSNWVVHHTHNICLTLVGHMLQRGPVTSMRKSAGFGVWNLDFGGIP
jgi:hypothetical protein